MKPRGLQSGYVSLLVMAVLLSGGAGLLSLSSTHGSRSTLLQSVIANQLPLQQARQSLLSYAATYPWLYGSQGAGLGHLPCPDTDYPDATAATLLQHRDGPNPPCGQQELSTGQLPRRVKLSGGHYAFTDLAAKRLHYSVYSSVINNPVNRPVNPSLLEDDVPLSVLARVSVSEPRGGIGDERLMSSVITPASLLLAIRPGVAAWVIDRMKEVGADRCVGVDAESVVVDVGAVAGVSEGNYLSASASETTITPDRSSLTRCQKIERLFSYCSEGQLPVLHRSSLVGVRESLRVLLLLVDEMPELDSCPESVISLLTIERVSVSRHWFYRNGWLEWVRIEALDDCVSEFEEPCSLVYQSGQAIAEVAEPVWIRDL